MVTYFAISPEKVCVALFAAPRRLRCRGDGDGADGGALDAKDGCCVFWRYLRVVPCCCWTISFTPRSDTISDSFSLLQQREDGGRERSFTAIFR